MFLSRELKTKFLYIVKLVLFLRVIRPIKSLVFVSFQSNRKVIKRNRNPKEEEMRLGIKSL